MSKSTVSTLDSNPSAAGKTDSAPVAPEAQVLKGVGPGDFSGDKAMLTIAASPGDGGRDAVFVSVAGVAFQIPRGKPWLVPQEVVNVLQDAVQTEYVRDEQTGVVSTIDSPRFTFVAQPVAAPAVAA